nr:hypothetical protein CTI12_AA035910 [Tanacetum cinerariifolium]
MQISYDIDAIHQMVVGLEGKIDLIEVKHDVTNSGLYYLCQVAGGIKYGMNAKLFQDIEAKLGEQSKITYEDTSLKVHDVKSNINQISYDIDAIHQMVVGLEGKIDLIEGKQDVTNSGLYYLCQVAGGIKDGMNAKLFQDIEAKLGEQSKITYEDTSLKYSIPESA